MRGIHLRGIHAWQSREFKVTPSADRLAELWSTLEKTRREMETRGLLPEG